MITTINEFKKYINENKRYTYIWDGFKGEVWYMERIGEWKWSITDTDSDTYNFNSQIDSELTSAKDAEDDMFDTISQELGTEPSRQINESNYDDIEDENEMNFNRSFVAKLSELYDKESLTSADWAGIHAWKISGEVWDGYFIVQDEDKSQYEVGFDIIHRYEDENQNTQQDIIMSLDTYINTKVEPFLNKAKQIKMATNVNERSDFDMVSNIGKITKNIKIDVLLKHSFHSLERQGRGSEYIKNSEIKETVDLATEKMVDLLISNKININGTVWIFNSKNNLNVVGALLPNKHNSDITFKLITVMFHENFNNKHKTYKITI